MGRVLQNSHKFHASPTDVAMVTNYFFFWGGRGIFADVKIDRLTVCSRVLT